MRPTSTISPSWRLAGTGARTLAPGSDIDLLFLISHKETAWVESVVEATLYFLWDLRLKVGHATRTVDECLRQARADMTIRTTLLEARLILGPDALFSELSRRFRTEIMAGTGREFVAAKLAERDKRISREGRSRYLVEPNVKEGKGGLRDLNTFLWIAKYVYGVDKVADLVKAGVFTPTESRLLHRCEEFLWRVRCHLHFMAGRDQERLGFERQPAIAGRLGYGAHGGLSAVERFMKHYFLIAKEVGDFSAIVCAALEAREAKPPAMLDRFVQRMRKRRTLKSRDFVVEHDRITTARPNVFETDPVNLIRLYRLSDEHVLAIHPDATREVARSLRFIDASLRNDPEANRLFIEILTSRNAPEVVLRQMNESGVLGRFVPQFGRIVSLMQFNMYHHYTVDEHLLRSIGILCDLGGWTPRRGPSRRQRHLEDDFQSQGSLRRHVSPRHRERAATRTTRSPVPAWRANCVRASGLSDAETETVSWLVLEHLTMSNTAQSRDLSDPRTIERFANVVQTIERLKMLIVLTACDIRAVGPGVWNGWKGSLLRTLYYETEVLLSGGTFGGGAQPARREGQRRPAGGAAWLVRSGFHRLCRAAQRRLLAQRQRRSPRAARAPPACRGARTALARDGSRHGLIPRRDGIDRLGARPSLSVVYNRRGLRRDRRQHRRCERVHDERRAGPRHDLRRPRIRPRRR